MIISFELYNESLKNFSFLVDKEELNNYFCEKIDSNTLMELYKEPLYFNDKEIKYIFLYTKGENYLGRKKKQSFSHKPLENLEFRVDKYSVRFKGETHTMYILIVNKDREQYMFYARNLVSCFRKVDELKKTTKKSFKDWL
jgi:hypothetical protein